MRLFFALRPPPSVAEQLASIARLCAGQFGGQPTREETIHLTLAFLGEVPEERLPLLVRSAQGVRQTPFDMSIDVLGRWDHNRLLWAGCASPPPELYALSESLLTALQEMAFTGDKRGFTPHLTLVRRLTAIATAAGSAIPDLPQIAPVQWRCSGFVLVHSRLTKSGSQYGDVAEFPFDGDAD